MWTRLLGKEFSRRHQLGKAPTGPLHDYLSEPFPSRRTFCAQIEIVSIDLETTGLDPLKDKILSVGLVHIRHLSIKLQTAWHEVIRVEGAVPEASAVIHQITDDRAAAGEPLELVMPQLLERIRGAVLLVHHASIEQGFLDAACRRLYGARFVAPIIDTEALARRTFERRHLGIKPGDLRLFNLRERYHLPRYNAHNALSDALATAELFLAMVSEMAPPRGGCRLGRLLTA